VHAEHPEEDRGARDQNDLRDACPALAALGEGGEQAAQAEAEQHRADDVDPAVAVRPRLDQPRASGHGEGGGQHGDDQVGETPAGDGVAHRAEQWTDGGPGAHAGAPDPGRAHPGQHPGKVWLIGASPQAITAADPTPCTIRPATNTAGPGASPQAAEPTASRTAPATKIRRRPTSSPMAPDVSRATGPRLIELRIQEVATAPAAGRRRPTARSTAAP
jgi:hypothetical protein